MPSTRIEVRRVDYADPHHADALIRLLHQYAEEETDAEQPLPAGHFRSLADSLADFPTALSVLAWSGSRPVGLINAFFGFSTFAQKRLINIHDVMVIPEFRGQGVAGSMIAEIETIARRHDCCRLTLEVLADNRSALRAYAKRGFGRTPYHRQAETLFLQKQLD